MYNYEPEFKKVYRASTIALEEIKALNIEDSRSIVDKARDLFRGYDYFFEEKKKATIIKLRDIMAEVMYTHVVANPNPFVLQKHIFFKLTSEKLKMRSGNDLNGAAVVSYPVRNSTATEGSGIIMYFNKDTLKRFLDGQISAKAYAQQFANMFIHELMHWDQHVKIAKSCVAKKWPLSKYQKLIEPKYKRLDKEYYSDPKEIAAYSMNTAQFLLFTSYNSCNTPVISINSVLGDKENLDVIHEGIFGLSEYYKYRKDLGVDFDKVYRKYMKNVCKQLAVFGENYGKTPYKTLPFVKMNSKINDRALKKVA